VVRKKDDSGQPGRGKSRRAGEAWWLVVGPLHPGGRPIIFSHPRLPSTMLGDELMEV
jgi:hypothetical protein